MYSFVLDFLGEVVEAIPVVFDRPSWKDKRRNRKYNPKEGDMRVRFEKRWPKPFPSQTFRNGVWTDNK